MAMLLHTLRSLRWVVVLPAALVYYLLAIPWFAPFAFGPAWRAATGRPGVPDVSGADAYLVPLAGTLSATIATAMLLRLTRAEGVSAGLRVGLFVAVCYSLAAVGIDAVAPNQPQPLTYFIIVGGYHLVGSTMATALIARFRG